MREDCGLSLRQRCCGQDLLPLSSHSAPFTCPGPQGPCDAGTRRASRAGPLSWGSGVHCPRGDVQSGEISPAGKGNLDLYFWASNSQHSCLLERVVVFLLRRKWKGNVCVSRREARPGGWTGRSGCSAGDTGIGPLQVSSCGLSPALQVQLRGPGLKFAAENRRLCGPSGGTGGSCDCDWLRRVGWLGAFLTFSWAQHLKRALPGHPLCTALGGWTWKTHSLGWWALPWRSS